MESCRKSSNLDQRGINHQKALSVCHYVCLHQRCKTKKQTKETSKQALISHANYVCKLLLINKLCRSTLYFTLRSMKLSMRVIEGKLDTVKMFYDSFFRQTSCLILEGMLDIILFSSLSFISLFFNYTATRCSCLANID